MAVAVLIVGMALWVTIVSLQLFAICWELRKQRADVVAQTQLLSRIADNAAEGARYLAEHRERIRRLERLTGFTHAGPN